MSGEVLLAVKVVPGASRDRIVGMLGDALKITVSRPPEGGAANKAVVALLAEALGVPTAQVRITRGHGSPRKQVAISGADIDDLRRKVADLLGQR